jgi:hypothetical protein
MVWTARSCKKSPDVVGINSAKNYLQFLVYKFSISIYNVYFHPLSHIPGPKLYAASYIPQTWSAIKGKKPFMIHRLHDKYGDSFAILLDTFYFAAILHTGKFSRTNQAVAVIGMVWSRPDQTGYLHNNRSGRTGPTN